MTMTGFPPRSTKKAPSGKGKGHKGKVTLMARKFAKGELVTSLLHPGMKKKGDKGRTQQQWLAKARKLGNAFSS